MKTKNKIKALISIVFMFLIVFNTAANAQPEEKEGNSFSTIDIPGHDVSWNDPSNAAFDDEIFATTDNFSSGGEFSDYLVVTNFMFDVSEGKIITGIEIIYDKDSENKSKTHDHSVRIIKGGVIAGDEKALSSSWQGQGNPLTYGSSSDLWSETWTPADINSNDFGIAISVERHGNGGGSFRAKIDNVKIRVTYSEPLPIELILFTGEEINGYNQLKWITASETNNDYFTIEKSEDGINYLPIGFIDGAGNSNTLTEYSFTDKEPYKNTYYRLKQTDFNGNYSYSAIVAVKRNNHGTTEVVLVNNNENINLFIKSGSETDANISFYNISGQLAGKETIHLTKGENNTSLNIQPVKGNIFFVVLNIEGSSEIYKFKTFAY